MLPSSRGISMDLPDSARWSNQSAGEDASSSGIHSRMACQGGSIGSKVSMSKGGSGEDKFADCAVAAEEFFRRYLKGV